MFVDFVHVHPLVGAENAQGSRYAATVAAQNATPPDRPCPVCQWLRADTGLQTPIASAVTTRLVVTDLVCRSSRHPLQVVVLSRDLRGPPASLFV